MLNIGAILTLLSTHPTTLSRGKVHVQKVSILDCAPSANRKTAGVHTSRTMMFRELVLLFENVPPDAPAEAYPTMIVDRNALGKPTQSTRARTAGFLTELYFLNPHEPVFRLFRHCWIQDSAGRPMLAFLTAATRDPLLRDMTPFALERPLNTLVSPTDIADAIRWTFPNRFRPSTLIATAQRLASSWTQAGYLSGKVSKRRVKPSVTPTVLTYALAIGYLSGVRGRSLFDTAWANLLDRSADELRTLTRDASKEGWLRLKEAGEVAEVTFPELFAATGISA